VYKTGEAARSLDLLTEQARKATDVFKSMRDAADQFAEAATAASSVKPPRGSEVTVTPEVDGSAAIESAAHIASRTQDAVASAVASFAPMFDSLAKELDRVGGTVVTMARRIDSAMKDPGLNRRLNALAQSFFNVGKGSARAMALIVQGGVSATMAVSRLNGGLAVLTATGATLGAAVASRFLAIVGAAGVAAGSVVKLGQAIHNFRSELGAIGDPAKRLFTQLFHIGTLGVFRRVGSEASAAGKAIGRVGSTARSVARDILAAFGVVGLVYKFSEGIKSAVGNATALEETLNKTRETFGGQAQSVIGNAEKMADAYKLPKNAILDAASSFGLIGKGAGMSEQAAAGMSNTLANLAADAASFYNVPLTEALEKIRSGLVGESEPLRAFGVLLSENAVKARAMQMGLAGNGKELSESAKVAARAAIIQEGLATAQGDLARTSTSAANQFRMAGGGLENFSTAIGQVLLPAIQSGIKAFNELLASVVEVFESNRPLIDGWANHLKAAMDAVGFVVRNFGTIWQIAQLRITESLANVLAVVDTLPENFTRIASYIGRNWYQIIVDGLNATATAFQNFGENAARFGMAIWEAIQGNGFDFEWKPLLDGFQATAEALPKLLEPVWVSVQDEIDKLGQAIANKELARAKNVASVVARNRPGIAPPAEKLAGKQGPSLAGIADINSREAYSAVASLRAGGGGKAADQTARNTSNLVETSKKQLEVLGKIATQAATGSPLPVFTF